MSRYSLRQKHDYQGGLHAMPDGVRSVDKSLEWESLHQTDLPDPNATLAVPKKHFFHPGLPQHFSSFFWTVCTQSTEKMKFLRVCNWLSLKIEGRQNKESLNMKLFIFFRCFVESPKINANMPPPGLYYDTFDKRQTNVIHNYKKTALAVYFWMWEGVHVRFPDPLVAPD